MKKLQAEGCPIPKARRAPRWGWAVGKGYVAGAARFHANSTENSEPQTQLSQLYQTRKAWEGRGAHRPPGPRGALPALTPRREGTGRELGDR